LPSAAPPEMTAALQRLKIWDKLKTGEIHTISRDNVQELFSVLDADGSGQIAKESLQVIRSVPNISLTEEDVTVLANDCDKDGSGRLSMDELYKAFTQGELAFSMVKDSLGKKSAQIDESNMPREKLILWVSEEYETQSALWSLPTTFVLFVLFMVLQDIHIQIERSWENQNAIRNEIVGEGPPYLTEHQWAIVHDVPTLWEWLNTSWVSSHFKQPVSEVFPYPGRFVSFNQIVGGVEFRRTQQVSMNTCEQGIALQGIYDTGNANGQVGDCHRSAQEGMYETEVTSEFFLYHENSDHHHEHLTNLSAATWLNHNTTELDVVMLLYNANQQVFTECHTIFTFYSSGRIWIHFDFETWRSEPYQNKLFILPDLVFSLILFRMFYQELKELIPACMSGLDGLMNYMEFWNIIDWMSIGMGVVVMTMWGQVCTLVSNDLQQISSELPMAQLDELVLQNGTFLTPQHVESVVSHEVLHDMIARLHDQSSHIASQHETLRMTIFLYSFVLMMKFFKAFQANPRLEIVTETLRRATEDIIHFMIIFSVIFFCFSCAGFVIFGRAMRGFSTQLRSMVTCWKILMGDFDIEEMTLIHPLLAPCWMVSFQFLVLLILLNMLLAIIMDTYMAAKTSKGAQGLTIWAQIREAVNTVRETRGHMDYWKIIVDLTDDDFPAHPQPIVTSKSLRRAFPKMTKHNAEYIIKMTARYIKEQADVCDLTMVDAIRLIGLIKTTSLRSANDVEQILVMMQAQHQAPQRARFDAIWDDPNAKLGSAGSYPAQGMGQGMGNMSMNQGMGQVSMGVPMGAGGPMGSSMPGMMPMGSSMPGGNVNSMLMTNTMQGSRSMSGQLGGTGAADAAAGGQYQRMSSTSGNDQQLMQVLRQDSENRELVMIKLDEIRTNQDEQRVWFDTKLCDLERRMDKVERGNERVVGVLQGIDFNALTALPSKLDAWAPRMAQVRQQGAPLVLPSEPQAANRKNGKAITYGFQDEVGEDEDASGSRHSSHGSGNGGELTFQEDTAFPGTPDLPSTEIAPAQQVRVGSVQKVVGYLETIMSRMETLVAHAEDSAESRRLLWKIDLGVRQLREKAGSGALDASPGSPAAGLRQAASAGARK